MSGRSLVFTEASGDIDAVLDLGDQAGGRGSGLQIDSVRFRSDTAVDFTMTVEDPDTPGNIVEEYSGNAASYSWPSFYLHNAYESGRSFRVRVVTSSGGAATGTSVTFGYRVSEF